MGRWSDAATWVGEGLRREVFFFPSGGVELYGSLYAAEQPTRALGLVVCGSWGVEADRSDPLAHGLALAAARLGGAGLAFHYPGFGDSHGELREATIESLATGAVEAAAAAANRSAATEWLFAGFTFGASVACLAHQAAGARGLVLLQPALRPSAYFERLARRADRATFGAQSSGSAFGYPVPSALLEGGSEVEARVQGALSSFEGEGVAISYETPAQTDGPELPDSIERVVLPGAWRFGSRDQPGMLDAAAGWIESCPVGIGEPVA